MFELFLGLACFGFIVGALGVGLAVKDRGKTRVRRGPEIYGEMMAERMRQDTMREGSIPIAQATWSTGKGIAVESEASYPMTEVKKMLREGRYRAVLPPLLIAAGLLTMPLFLGLAILQRATGDMRYGGYFLIVASAYAAWLMGKDAIKE